MFFHLHSIGPSQSFAPVPLPKSGFQAVLVLPETLSGAYILFVVVLCHLQTGSFVTAFDVKALVRT